MCYHQAAEPTALRLQLIAGCGMNRWGSFRELESRPRESSMAVVGSYIAGGIADLVLRKHDGGTSEAKKCV